MDLFPSEENLKEIDLSLPDSEIIYYPKFFSEKEASSYFEHFKTNIPWRQDDIKIFGKIYPQPRLTALFANNSNPYSYSGIKMQPLPFTSELIEIKNRVEQITRQKFTTVLLNLYRDGSDSNGWHSDDEKELGKNPFIASVNFGAKRRFHLRHKSRKTLKQSIDLEHGSLLTMGGSTQHYWQHQLPKSKRVTDPRINLTFRLIE